MGAHGKEDDNVLNNFGKGSNEKFTAKGERYGLKGMSKNEGGTPDIRHNIQPHLTKKTQAESKSFGPRF